MKKIKNKEKTVYGVLISKIEFFLKKKINKCTDVEIREIIVKENL